jgi:hypothetical protein
MTNVTADASQRKAARIAGLLFLLSLIVPLLNWTLVLSGFIETDNAGATAHNMLSREFLFRIGIMNDILTSIVALSLAVALYAILKQIDKTLALLALFLKLTEAVLWAVMTLRNLDSLLILKGLDSLAAGSPEQIQTLIGLFLNAHMSKSAVAGIFLGLSSTLFFYLFLKSGYVSSILAGFGMLSYALIVLYDSMLILFPNYAKMLIMQVIGWGPSILAELVIGFRLLIKGIYAQPYLVDREKRSETRR